MRTKVIIFVVIICIAFGLGWYVSAQVTRQLPDFVDGQVLTAAELNAIVAQVNSNTAAIGTLGSGLTLIDSTGKVVGVVTEIDYNWIDVLMNS